MTPVPATATVTNSSLIANVPRGAMAALETARGLAVREGLAQGVLRSTITHQP